MVFIFFLAIVGVPVLFVLFSAPKSKLKKITPRIITGLSSDNVVDETEVFRVIKNAGIEPCFLDLDDDKKNDSKTTSNVVTGISNNNVDEERDVFRVLENAGVEPCFLKLDDEAENNSYPKMKNAENFDKPIELQSFEVKTIESPIKVRVRKK